MENKEYKKTYKSYIAWLIGYSVIAIIIAQSLSSASTKVSALAVLITMAIGLYILMLIIYKGEYVYWINGGPSYEEAESAGSEKRKEYAKAHLDKFFKMMLLVFLYGIISVVFKFSMWIDIWIISLLIIITAFSTISIRFNK